MMTLWTWSTSFERGCAWAPWTEFSYVHQFYLWLYEIKLINDQIIEILILTKLVIMENHHKSHQQSTPQASKDIAFFAFQYY